MSNAFARSAPWQFHLQLVGGSSGPPACPATAFKMQGGGARLLCEPSTRGVRPARPLSASLSRSEHVLLLFIMPHAFLVVQEA